jgi:hypothetical protein
MPPVARTTENTMLLQLHNVKRQTNLMVRRLPWRLTPTTLQALLLINEQVDKAPEELPSAPHQRAEPESPWGNARKPSSFA